MAKSNKKLVDHLSVLLADTYILSLKTQNYHWNVTGPYFPSYHSFFEGQYEALFKAGDDIAERIRSLGAPAPGSYAAFSKIKTLTEETGSPKASEMIKKLVADHKKIIAKLYEIMKISQDLGDEGTTDFLIERLREHEKTLWMLESTL